jgi:flavorubredoxin
MYNPVTIKENIYFLGVNDRRTELFENLWPIEQGISYNSYLIVDEKIALVDTVERSHTDEFLSKIKTIINDKKIDYLIINHMEPDHSGGIKAIVNEYPDITLVGNKMTFNMLKNYYNITENTHQVKNGNEINLGSRSLQFFQTPWVHWPETMMTYDKKEKVLFSGDAFGSFGTLDGGIFDDELNIEWYEDEMLRYYSNIVGKYSDKAQAALQKLSKLEINIIAATHGPVWRSHIPKVLDLYQKWTTYQTEKGVVIVFGSMYGNTEHMADTVARRLAENGLKNIRIYDASKTHISYIIRDIWKFKGVILGSSAYNATLFPKMETLIKRIEHMDIKDHLLGIFGSSSWNGSGVKALNKFAESFSWEIVSESVETKGSPDQQAIEKCISLADNMAERLKKEFDQ